MTSQQLGEEVIMDDKYMQSDWIGENKTKPQVDTCRFNQKKGEFETMSEMQKMINAQKTYISTLEKGISLRNKLIEKYEETIHLQEERIGLLENKNRLIERYEATIELIEKQNKKLVGLIEDYKALCRGIAGLEDE